MYKKEKPQMSGFMTLVFTTFYDKEKESDCQAENHWHHVGGHHVGILRGTVGAGSTRGG